MSLDPLRLCAYWDQIAAQGYAWLDRQLAAAAGAGRRVILTVGMKGLGWPEFYPPKGMELARAGWRGVVAGQGALRQPLLDFVETTVRRYRDRSCIGWWQVENESFDRAGPGHRWVERGLLAAEIDLVRSLDERPIALNAFGHLGPIADSIASNLWVDVGALVGRGSRVAGELLALLRPGDVVGLDLYHRVGIMLPVLGRPHIVIAARNWLRVAARLRDQARARGVETWVMEAQAEPWEPTAATAYDPISLDPATMVATIGEIVATGFDRVLLWGVEYWLGAEHNGNDAWLKAGEGLLAPATP
jgi:hypothetical protein